MGHELKKALFVLGFTSVVAQVLILRELAASFYGNEFFLGWALFSWLLWTGLGSSWGGRTPREVSAVGRVLALSSFLVAVLTILEIAVIRSGRSLIGAAPGALPDVFFSLFFSFAAVGPLCFFLGAQFTLAVRAASDGWAQAEPARLMGTAYFFETLGFVAGGVAFSFLLVRMDAFATAALIFWMNGTTACSCVPGNRRNATRPAIAAISLIAAAVVLGSGPLEKGTSQWRFPSEDLVLSQNTLRGNIAVTRLGKQHDFYQNGMLLGADRESLLAEHLVHFPMLAHPRPRKVLFLGTGLNGFLGEVLKHGPEEVTAIDIDPEFERIAAGFLPYELQKVLRDPRLRSWHGDSRDFFRGTSEQFDVILANFPDPLSILINRQYTAEFFGAVRDHLAPGGVFATKLGFSANYVTPELELLGGSVYATLRKAFPTVKVLPEDTAYFLASAGGEDLSDTAKMIERMRERKIAAAFVTPDYLRYRFTNDRVSQVETLFKKEPGSQEGQNHDLEPRSYYFAFVRWLSLFHSRVSKIFLGLTTIPFAVVFTIFLLLFAAPVLIVTSPQTIVRRLSLAATRTAGFTVMGFEIILIYLFQVFSGDLYYRIAMLITVLMAGIGAGAWAAPWLKIRSYRKTIAVIHSVAAFFYAGLTLFVVFGAAKIFALQTAQAIFFYGAAALGGILAGLEFPFANGLYQEAGKGGRAGAVYAADLEGSCLGALVTAAFLIPVWGVIKTLVLLAAMNALLALLLFLRKDLGRKDL